MTQQSLKERFSPLMMLAGQCGYLDVSAELGGETFLLHIFNRSFTSEQVNSRTRRQETLMLLPLQRLEEETVGKITSYTLAQLVYS